MGILALAEPELEGRGHLLNLICAATTYDCRGDGWVVKRPGHGDYAGTHAVTAANFAQQAYQPEIAAQARLVEFRRPLSPVIGGQLCHALRGHLAGQQAGALDGNWSFQATVPMTQPVEAVTVPAPGNTNRFWRIKAQ